jgi:23S rRNA pseudouridine1911/1915/1917 synthase
MLEPTIIYEDDKVLVVNKPAGLVVHADGRTVESTLVDWIVRKMPEIHGVGEPIHLTSGEVINRPGIVHRLDRETSGVMVIAKTHSAYLFLKDQFQNRETAKTYRAFVWGKMAKLEGRIDLPIGKSKRDFRRWSAQRHPKEEARDAVTDYKVLAQVAQPGDEMNGHAYLELYPRTGRTHQIRVHLKALSHPVIGDNLYAPARPYALGFDRLALHALSIVIELPSGRSGGTRQKFEAPLPDDFLFAERSLQHTLAKE